MQNRDYILRMIEQLGQALVMIRQMILNQTDSPAAVQRELQGIARENGFDLDLARVLDIDTLLAMMSVSGDIDATRLWLMAEILFLDALEAEADGRTPEAMAGFGKAERLYQLVEPGGMFLVGWPDAEARIREIEEHRAAVADRT